MCHTISLIQKLDLPLKTFSQQEFEATHKWHKLIYYHSTSHDGGKGNITSMKQILIKIYRKYFIETFDNITNCKGELNIK